jgi:hypothetical protein
MAPIKSSLARSAKKLLGVFRDRDTSLRGHKQSSRLIQNNILTVPSAIDATLEWDLEGNPLVISSVDTYDISLSPKNAAEFSITTHIWGAGGGSGTPIGGPTGGGAGGFTVGDFTLVRGTTYKFVVGSSDATPTNPGQPTGHGANAGCGGGYSGVFTTSVSQANAVIMAGGGGGSGGNDGGTMGSGGAGGGSTAQNGIAAGGYGDSPGDGGTQSAGGSGGTGSNNGGNGTALQGGGGGARGGSGAGGGGGGSGYYGGGGGAGQSAINTGGGGGGGGSGYLHPSLITNGTTTTGSGKTRVETSPYTPQIPSTASKGNNQSNELSLPSAQRGGAGCIVIELAS